MKTLTIRSFGGLEIWLDDVAESVIGASASGATGQRIKFETRTVEALLVYLACQGRPLGRDALAELLWPERTQAQARANLRVAIHSLRQQLAPYLLITRQSVALNLNAQIDLDVADFEAHLAAGQLMAATALYRGDFLDGFYRDGSPDFEQWSLLERERLRTLALAAYQQLIDQNAAAGQGSSAIANAQRLLQLDPLHEPTHRQLMRLLAQRGQRSAALAQYETFRRLLAVELDVSPDETTTALYDQIHSADFGRLTRWQEDKVMGTVSHPVSLTLTHKLPPQPTPLIGRNAELAQLEQLLANPDCRLLTLLGVGGIGKSHLALEAAGRQAKHFADGVYFVALAPIESGEFVLTTLAQSLGIVATSGDLQAEIAAYLQPRTVLLVLDNFEHLVATPTPDPGIATDLLVYLLRHAPQVKFLVTSRARLALREEWLLPIAGLSLADDLASEAAQLFLRSAQRVQPGFTGAGQEAMIATLCRQVEGMPLALELAASWVRVMACAEIARQIAANFDFLTSSLRNLPVRHSSLRALFEHSWRLLSLLEQGVLMRLSVFRGGWQLDEAAPVTGATLALLLGLVDKSLVRANGQNRFDLHELVRQYAAEHLAASGEADLIRHRHYLAYLHLFRSADSHLRGPEHATWFARLYPEHINLRTALQWALDATHYTDAAWLVLAANWFWEQHGLQSHAGRFLVQLLPHHHELAPDLRLAIWIILNAASVHVPEEFNALVRATTEVMELLEESSDNLLQSAAWAFIGRHETDFAQRSTFLERAIALARAAGETAGLGPEFCLLTDRAWLLGTELLGYASDLLEHGEFARAALLARENVALFQAHWNRYERAGGLGLLGHLALLQGDLEQAHQILAEAVTIAVAASYQELVCSWQPLLARVVLYHGDSTIARRLLTESLKRSNDLKLKPIVARIHTYLAETALWLGEVDEAEQWLVLSLTDAAELDSNTISELERFWVAARLKTAQQQYLRAALLFGLADQMDSHLHHVISGPIRTLADDALGIVRESLEPALFAETFTVGQQLSRAEAYAAIQPSSYPRSLA